MKRRFPPVLGTGSVLVFFVLLGVIAFGVVQWQTGPTEKPGPLDGFRPEDIGAQQGPARPGNLLAGNRTHLSLCVDGAGGGSITSVELDRVSSALDSGLGSLDRIPPEFGQPSVTAGCPPPIPLTGERLDSFDLCCGFSTRITDAALLSLHRLFIYFVPDDTYAASFGPDQPYARAVPERVCRGDFCSEMTVAVYFPQTVATEVLAQGILEGLALHATEPRPTFDPQGFLESCQQGTPVAGCDRYFLCITPTPMLNCDSFWREIGLEPPP